MPDSLAGLVTAVTGLSTLGHAVKPADFGAPDAFVNATPCSRYYGAADGEDAAEVPAPDAAVRGVRLHAGPAARRLRRRRVRQHAEPRPRPDRRDHRRVRRADAARGREQVRRRATATGRSRTGSSRTGACPRMRRPATTAAATAGTASRRSTSRPCTGWLPARTSSTTAPRAASTTTCSPRCRRSSHDNKASIVTNSWGEPTFVVDRRRQLVSTIDDSLVAAYETIFKQGAVQGIGFMFSSGDDGDELADVGLRASRTIRPAIRG